MRFTAFVALAFAFCACSKGKDPCSGVSGACVTLTVQGQAPGLDQLHITVDQPMTSNLNTAVMPLSLPFEMALELPPGAMGTVHIDVIGLAQMKPVGHGATDAMLANNRGKATVTLGAITPLSVTPPTANVKALHTTTFMANLPVTWSIMEGPIGGTIDKNGVYAAPVMPGSYHIVAIAADGTALGTAAVTVVPLALDVLAGSTGGPGTVDGPAATARFNGPNGVAFAAGTLYVADSQNETIRKIDLAAGTVTTVAGQPLVVGSVDGPGAQALFGSPLGIAADATNVYVAEYTNELVRQIVAQSGMVSTIAGVANTAGHADGAAGSSLLAGPSGVALDGSGNLYVADADSNVLRKIALASDMISTVAGTANMAGSTDGMGAAALFSGPNALAFDGARGLVYVSDSRNDTVRSFAPANAAVATVAGTAGMAGAMDGTGAAARFDHPAGIGFDGTAIYVGDTGSATVRRIDPASAAVTTIAGKAYTTGYADGAGTDARFIQPAGIATDGQGAVYVADAGGSVIRKIAGGSVSTIAGMKPAVHGYADGAGAVVQFGAPAAVAVDGTNLYVFDGAPNYVVRQVALADGTTSTIAGTVGTMGIVDGSGTSGRITTVTAAVSDGMGTLYFCDGTTIRKLVIATATVTTLAGSAGAMGTADGNGSAAQFMAPVGIAWEPTSKALYVADQLGHTVRQVTTDGTVSTFAGVPGTPGDADGIAGAAGFEGPTGIAADGRGNLFVGDIDELRDIIVSTQMVNTVAGLHGISAYTDGPAQSARFDGIAGVVVDAAGGVDLVDVKNNVVRHYDTATKNVSTLVGAPSRIGLQAGMLPASINGGSAIAVTPTGDLVLGGGNEPAVAIIH